jgi:lipopolysaccharide/colanic/teichoic acid biosynthesis glycosyltransferase
MKDHKMLRAMKQEYQTLYHDTDLQLLLSSMFCLLIIVDEEVMSKRQYRIAVSYSLLVLLLCVLKIIALYKITNDFSVFYNTVRQCANVTCNLYLYRKRGGGQTGG